MSLAATSFVLGYHGCDRSIAERVFAGNSALEMSRNNWDWLGHGVYFWEHNASRAYEYACELRDLPRSGFQQVRTPAVVGAIIDLKFCLNLLDSEHFAPLRNAYLDLKNLTAESGEPMPRNTSGPDRLKRQLDCAVIEFLHASRAEKSKPPFDSVRAMFPEGGPLYEGAGFNEKNHIQVCVRSPACVVGYFRPLDEDGRPMRFARRLVT